MRSAVGALRSLAAAVWVLALTTRALADPNEAEAEARRLHERALIHYNVADYALAIEDFKAAYQLSPASGLLFNIAQSYRLMGNCAEALRFYRTYLREAPEAANAKTAEEHAGEMERCSARAEKPPPVAPPTDPATGSPITRPRPEVEEDAPAPRWPALVVGATGIVVGGAGAALYVSAGQRHAELEESCQHRCEPSEWESARTRERVGIGAMIAGGAALAVGAIWYLSLSGSSSERRAELWVAPSVGGMMAGGRF